MATAFLTFTAVAPGPSSITIEIDATGAPNLPLSITVVGDAITIQLATDGAGNPSPLPANSGFDLIALYNATPAAVALASLTVQFPSEALPGTLGALPLGPANSGPITPQTGPVSSLQLFDSNKVAVSNAPVLDIFMNGGQKQFFSQSEGIIDGTPYGNGALVPPLYYPKDSGLQIDVYSQITDATKLPTGLLIHLVGKKYYPC